MPLRQSSSGPIVTPQLMIAIGTADENVVPGARISLTENRSVGGISIVSNRFHVTEPGWYELTGFVSVGTPAAVDGVFAARLTGASSQGSESQVPFIEDQGAPGSSASAAPIENLFLITDPETQEVQILNVAIETLNIRNATLVLKRVG